MGLLSRGGYDKREEQDALAEAQAKLPLCENCPRGEVARDIKIALDSESAVERCTGQLAKEVLELAGCKGPTTLEFITIPDRKPEDIPPAESVCMNPYIETARDILSLTQRLEVISR